MARTPLVDEWVLASAAYAAKKHSHWCPGKPFDEQRLDFSPCLEEGAFNLAPVLLIILFGVPEAVSLWRIWKGGYRQKSRDGLAAMRAKLALAGLLCLVQAGFAIAVAFEPHPLAYDLKFPVAIVTLATFVFVAFLHHLTHPLLPHASSPLLFYYLLLEVVYLVQLRTMLSLAPPSTLGKAELASFILYIVRFAIVTALFSIELMGPRGWDNTTWRDWVPFVAPSEGKIKLPADDEDVDDENWEQAECPKNRANIFSVLTFSWLTPMMKEGVKKYLTEEDLWALPPDDQADALGNKFEAAWKKRKDAAKEKGTKPSLLMALVSAYGGPFFLAAFFKFLQDLLSFTQPQLLGRLLVFVQTYNSPHPDPAFHGYVIAIAMFACAVVQTLFLHAYFSRVFEVGMRVRAGLISLIYKKSLVLSNLERAARATGDVVNLQATDATRLQDLCSYGQVIWSGVFQITLAFISLYRLLGWTMFVGVAVMILSMPLTAMIARVSTRLQRQQMKNKDQRTRMMSEILNNIRSIKLYAWEDSFAQKLFEVRNKKELVLLRRMGYISSASSFLWSFTPTCVSFASFALFSTLSGKPLTSEIVFPAITLFNMLGFPLAVLPNVFTAWVEAYVSLQRLTDFLCAKELEEEAVTIEQAGRGAVLRDGDELVSITGGEFTWNVDAESALEGIDLSVKKGQLVSVVGRVGSGKSSLLSAILGEMTKKEGKVVVRGKVAFAAQQPWIMGGTVRSNITFGHRYEPEYYQTVLEACALKDDLAILPNGDATEVGEKGISLSGGQKARLSLARAVYARADIYLLDDPLSAVDAHVGKHLFDRVLGPEGLLASKARVLSTNAIPYCELSDELVMLRKGIIVERGTFASANGTDSELGRLLAEFGNKGSDGSTGEGDEELSSSEETAVDEKELAVRLEKEQLDPDQKRRASISIQKGAEELSVEYQKRATLRALKRSTRPKEKRSQGSVKWDVYKKFIKANTYWGTALYTTTIILQQVLSVSTNVWLKNWSQHNNDNGNNGNLPFYLGIYGALGVAASVMGFIGGVTLYSVCVIRSAQYMHDNMYHSVIRSPMRFFEVTPLGTILNRFSADTYVIDEVLARVFGGFFRTLAGVFAMIAVISFSAPAFLLVVTPLMLVYKRVQTYYLATSRELKRLNSTTKSPIFASFQETLQGVSTIRAYRQSARFIAENDARVDRNNQAYYPSICCNRWLAVRLEFLGSCIIFSTAMLAVISLVRNRGIDAGIVGLMLSYALSTTQTLNWIVRSATEVETNIVSVERVSEYIDLPPEAPREVKENKPPADWPSKGAISFEGVVARYREDLDPCLRGTTFTVQGGERIGIVGRTGAGKSSLTMVLYRIIEAEEGRVVIDGVDVGKIGLQDLRSRLSIIPQDSQCFDGSLRENLDPTGKATDQQLWKALEQCNLKEHVSSMDGQLDAHIDEGGSNLSQGQRQLMCLGRALLRQSKILVLDEATAAVDVESDREIQAVIRDSFKDCTVFTIAHRINTILDADKILTIDKGRVAEFASPAELLANKDSIFYSLALQAGVIKQQSGLGSASGSNTPRSGTRTPARKD